MRPCAEPEIRPKVQVLVYPCIDTRTPLTDGAMDPWYADQGYPPIETSPYLLVTEQTPPAFLAAIKSDGYCPPAENTRVYARVLAEHGVASETVEIDDGEHGNGYEEWWSIPCAKWLREQGWAAAGDGS